MSRRRLIRALLAYHDLGAPSVCRAGLICRGAARDIEELKALRELEELKVLRELIVLRGLKELKESNRIKE